MMVAMAAAAAIGLTVSAGALYLDQSSVQAQPALDAAEPLVPGMVLPADSVRFIEKPGRYGLGSELPGSRYAIVNGHLVRVSSETMELQSILRRNTLADDRLPAHP